MFGLFKKKEQKDPVCGMTANDKFITKYGEKFCCEGCVKKYEDDNQIADGKGCGGSCCG